MQILLAKFAFPELAYNHINIFLIPLSFLQQQT